MGLFGKKKDKETKPVAEEPKIAETPVPAEEPKPVEEAPAPVEEAPAPVEETPAPVEEAPAPAEDADSCNCLAGAAELTCKEQGTVYQVVMNYHAGYDQYNEYPNGGKTIHAGVGHFHPFGVSRYWGVANVGGGYCKEAEDFPVEKFFTEDWMKQYETDLFCIYRLDDGDIYAWDGIFAVRGPDPHGDRCVGYRDLAVRQDALVNIIVGGTGRYEGARGVMVGTAEGGGDSKAVAQMPDGKPLELPATIIKHLEGYIRIPDKAE